MSYILVGASGSPYTQKMKSYLRYKQVNFEFQNVELQNFSTMWSQKFPGIPKVIPVLVCPDGSYKNDSTFLIADLEHKTSIRSVYPDDPAMHFITLLVEDFADEWLTKIMYAGRWLDTADAKFAGKFIAGTGWYGSPMKTMSRGKGASMKVNLPTAAAMFENIQVKRIQKVGCADWDLLEETARSVCQIISDNHKDGHSFIFGDRPSVADFAIWGQMSQFLVDFSVNQILRDYPFSYAWVHSFEDLSGFKPGKWDSKPSNALKKMLILIGQIYIPFLKANASAAARGQKEFTVAFMKGRYFHTQSPFGYQVKCLNELKKAYSLLGFDDRSRVSEILRSSGCENIFEIRSRL